MNKTGTIIVVHAHGDNMDFLRRWVPRFPGPLVGDHPEPALRRESTTSAGSRTVTGPSSSQTPWAPRRSCLAGFDLDDPTVGPVKRGGLLFARGSSPGSQAMTSDAVILDGYIDEPACLGVCRRSHPRSRLGCRSPPGPRVPGHLSYHRPVRGRTPPSSFRSTGQGWW